MIREGTDMIDYRQAQQIVLAQARSFGKEEVRLAER